MFYVNKDGIRTHKIFEEHFNYDELKGEREAFLLPAATNVANTAYIIASLLLEYRNIFLCGFDYSFDIGGQYYGTATYNDLHRDNKKTKKKFDNHITILGIDNKLTQTSNSMVFSAKWLMGAIHGITKAKKINTVNLTGRGILQIPLQAKIKEVENAEAKV